MNESEKKYIPVFNEVQSFMKETESNPVLYEALEDMNDYHKHETERNRILDTHFKGAHGDTTGTYRHNKGMSDLRVLEPLVVRSRVKIEDKKDTVEGYKEASKRVHTLFRNIKEELKMDPEQVIVLKKVPDRM